MERHRKKATIWVSNREPSEWLAMTTDALLAQSAIDRLTSGAHNLIIEGPSHRQRQRVTVDGTSRPSMLTDTSRWSHARGNEVFLT